MGVTYAMDEAEMRRLMVEAVMEMLGEGYVDEYYEDMANDFIGVALAFRNQKVYNDSQQ